MNKGGANFCLLFWAHGIVLNENPRLFVFIIAKSSSARAVASAYLQVFIERWRVELMHETAVVLLNDLLMRQDQIAQVLDVEQNLDELLVLEFFLLRFFVLVITWKMSNRLSRVSASVKYKRQRSCIEGEMIFH